MANKSNKTILWVIVGAVIAIGAAVAVICAIKSKRPSLFSKKDYELDDSDYDFGYDDDDDDCDCGCGCGCDCDYDTEIDVDSGIEQPDVQDDIKD